MRDRQPHSDSDQESGKQRSGHESDAAAATVQLFFATRNRRPELEGIVIHFFNEIGFLNFSFQFEKLNYLSKWDKNKTFLGEIKNRYRKLIGDGKLRTKSPKLSNYHRIIIDLSSNNHQIIIEVSLKYH
jgi:hypothetical protein